MESIASVTPGSGGRRLPLDIGMRSPRDFDLAAQAYVEDFAFERVADQKVRSARQILSSTA
jgi:hypothetical protein